MKDLLLKLEDSVRRYTDAAYEMGANHGDAEIQAYNRAAVEFDKVFKEVQYKVAENEYFIKNIYE